MKGIFWIMGFVGNPAYFEWVSYTGYKFVMLCPIVISHYFFGYWPSYAVLVALCLCFSRFFYMTLKQFSGANTLQSHMTDSSLSRKTMTLAACGFQCAIIWLLTYN